MKLASTILIILLSTLRASDAHASEKNEWSFQSVYGQSFLFTDQHGDLNLYSGDVGHLSVQCEEPPESKICIEDYDWSILIPVGPLKPGLKWALNSETLSMRSEFEIVHKTEALRWLDVDLGTVYVIAVDDYIENTRTSRELTYSVKFGILSMELSDGPESVQFFAQQIPSLGSSPDE